MEAFSRQEIESKALEILGRYPVRKAAFFGSVLSGRMGQSSDIDMLVEFDPGTPGLDFFGLKTDLEEGFERPVDLMTFNALNRARPEFRGSVQKEAHVFYDRTNA